MDPNVSQQAYTSMMKFTIDGRPYLKDIHDLFAALIVQIPLDVHRYLFRNYPNTFSSDDAIQALGSLRFSYTARMPDPNDPSKLLRTTTTTTFNMEKDMAKTLLQQFQQCRLMENATDPQSRAYREKGIWQLTPKGLCVLQDFCVRTEADMTTLRKYFGHVEPIQLVRLERHADDDQIIHGRQNLSVVFRIMMTCLPLEGEHHQQSVNNNTSTKATSGRHSDKPVSAASSQSSSGSSAPFAMASQSDSRVQLLANNLLTQSKKKTHSHAHRSIKHMRTVFSTQLCTDWLTDYSTVSSREEAETLANEFVKYGWVEFQDPKQSTPIRASKTIMLIVTSKGKEVVAEDNNKSNNNNSSSTTTTTTGSTTTTTEQQQTTLREMLSQDPNDPTPASTTTTTTTTDEPRPPSTASMDPPPPSNPPPMSSAAEDVKESNAARLKVILDDAQLRSLFKDFLRANFCEENLDFWIDYDTLRRKCRAQSPAMPSQNQKDLLEDAHDIWSTYLAPGSRCELNVEHTLRQEMARVVNSMVQVVPTFTPGQVKPTIVISTPSTSQSLRMMLKWLDRVNEHICRLMASDSVPKFVKTPKYRKIVEAREKLAAKDDMFMAASSSSSSSENHTTSSGPPPQPTPTVVENKA
ncbi:hypothetical protein O0I10_000284 [Lichtheimia ornata]|uniref:RGS domain-containing protein n=1 Tax=Lichtheimia ornata TaxID=688661 RepID=A0AAD8DJV9_9FUNG|nr:uncharacterized protein O0I10_000284 [Lichtheimia ornata]KAJ8664007.1 hypothetical protein O0I10_000284 [Lichtheimia ornata]